LKRNFSAILLAVGISSAAKTPQTEEAPSVFRATRTSLVAKLLGIFRRKAASPKKTVSHCIECGEPLPDTHKGFCEGCIDY
jgi:hypothetical protein